MTRSIDELYSREIQEDKFAMLVAARVNEILSGTAKVLEFKPVGGVFYTPEQQHLMFADKIARAVCANLQIGEEK
jgi:hypothetical protein